MASQVRPPFKAKQTVQLLPLSYYLLTFTLPAVRAVEVIRHPDTGANAGPTVDASPSPG